MMETKISAELADGVAAMTEASERIVGALGGLGTRVRATVGAGRVGVVGTMACWLEPGVVEIRTDAGKRYRARVANAHGIVIDPIEVAS